MIDGYPMRTLGEASASIIQAIKDRRMMLIGDAQLAEVKAAYNERLRQIKSQEFKKGLMSSAAHLRTRSVAFVEPQKMGRPGGRPIPINVNASQRRAPRGQ